MSGLTSQANLNSLAEALRNTERETGLDIDALNRCSDYWESVREVYYPFESGMRAGTSQVYKHEIPGGQITNLKEQAQKLGLGARWREILKTYADVNQLFGDIVKVTPTSKVVGDMALFMVANDLTPEQVADPAREIAFPESVVALFRGELGSPPEGFPRELQRKVLKGAAPIEGRPGARLAPADLEAARAEAEKAVGRRVSDRDLASWLMYPKVFEDYARHERAHGDVSAVPTPVFFNGLALQQEIAVDLEPGKTLAIRLQGRSEAEDEAESKLFFELNGQPRVIRVAHAGAAPRVRHPKAQEGNEAHVGAPMPGFVVTVAVHAGQKVEKGDPLVSIEAMKMETQIRSERSGVIGQVHARPGMRVEAKDLLLEVS
jgi:pyruvate carboxylase